MNNYILLAVFSFVAKNVIDIVMAIVIARTLNDILTRLTRIESREPPADGGI